MVSLYGSLAPTCDEHAEKRLEHEDAIDETEFFLGDGS
jgi:hypothetical protein